MPPVTIDVQGVVKRFGQVEVLRGIDLTVAAGELVALLGPSGSGKTSLLRIIGGLEQADRGVVRFDGQDAAARPVGARGVGFVFQHYALFRHMTVARNIAFGLEVQPRARRPDRAAIRETVARLLALVQLDGLGHRYPGQLSGGQRQRVALARALAVAPRVLLLDEPFGALDAKVRKDLRRWLRRLHDDTGATTVFVTHDQDEAFEIADQVALMNDGRIEQIGAPQQVYDRPASAFVYDFLGHANRLSGVARDGMADFGAMRLAAPAGLSGPVLAFIRPADLVPVDGPGADRLSGTVVGLFATGLGLRCDLAVPGLAEPVAAEFVRSAGGDRRIGRGTVLHLQPAKVQFLPRPGGAADRHGAGEPVGGA